MSERSLGDPAPDEGDRLDPNDYDVADFAAGIRPGRRSVTVAPRPDLYPELQAVVDAINEAPDDANVDALIDRFDGLKARMQVTLTLERRSPEWVKEFYKVAAAEMGVDQHDKGMADVTDGKFTEAHAVELACRMVAAQVVDTSDGEQWGHERLLALHDVAPEQVEALADAVQKVNAGYSEALTLDFSQRRSTRNGTRRSSTN